MKIRREPFMCVLFAVVGQHLCHVNIFLGRGCTVRPQLSRAPEKTWETIRLASVISVHPSRPTTTSNGRATITNVRRRGERASSSFNRPLRICVRSRKTQRVSLASPCLSCFTPMLLLQSESCSLRRSMQWIEAS